MAKTNKMYWPFWSHLNILLHKPRGLKDVTIIAKNIDAPVKFVTTEFDSNNKYSSIRRQVRK